MGKPLSFRMTPDEDDCMTMPVEEFLGAVKAMGFMDDDGYGFWAQTEASMSNQVVRPSDVGKRGFAPPEWATHVVWFNK